MTDTTELAGDLLYGVPRIAEYLGLTPAAVYHLVASKRLPAFRVGKIICARKTTIAAAITELEAEAGA
jgi:excisionase family DNA binding protein